MHISDYSKHIEIEFQGKTYTIQLPSHVLMFIRTLGNYSSYIAVDASGEIWVFRRHKPVIRNDIWAVPSFSLSTGSIRFENKFVFEEHEKDLWKEMVFEFAPGELLSKVE